MFRLADRLIEAGATVDTVASVPGTSWRKEVGDGARLVDIALSLTRP